MTIISDLAYLEAANKFRQRYMHGSKVMTWTRKREDTLKDLFSLGLDPAIIAIELGLGEKTVLRRLKVLGLRR